ncbi:MAG TPA: ATP synthase F1 subunit gamma [bacterium]|jgi:F-type H+-transporting ATPase subunit gamma|nr:ATP synthase F1 subunit gamma [bacterium]
MPSLREIRGRIKSARNIQQITKAMKMVAAARLRRSQERMTNARPYARLIAEVLKEIGVFEEAAAQPLLKARPGALTGSGTLRLVVFTADKGLCGAFNVNVLRKAAQIIREQRDKRRVEVVAVGRKGRDFFSHFGVPLVGQYVQLGLIESPLAGAIAREQMEAYLSGAVDEVLLLATEFKSVISLKPSAVRLLPFEMSLLDLDGPWSPAGAADGAAPPKGMPPAYEPSRAEVFRELVPRAVEMQVWKTLLESQACEFAARMTAMDNASRNSKELIGSLTLYANRIRQAVITKEIAELVGGAEALK